MVVASELSLIKSHNKLISHDSMRHLKSIMQLHAILVAVFGIYAKVMMSL